METLDSGNAVFNPMNKGVATSTSPRSLLRSIKMFFVSGFVIEEIITTSFLEI